MKFLRIAFVLSGLLLPSALFAQSVSNAIAKNEIVVSTNETLVATNVFTGNTATNPAPRSSNTTNWFARHEGFVKIAKAGGVNLLFLGDSITDGWRTRGSNVWNKFYASRNAANFGIGGDRTENVLWRIEHGELDGINPKLVVLMIGTNNTGKERGSDKIRNTTAEAIQGIIAIVKAIRAKLPETKILVLGIFPRAQLDAPQRAQVSQINPVIAKLDDGKMVKYLDISPQFLESDGTLSKDIMPDGLHPNERGYQIWANAIEPVLVEMLK